MPVVVSASNIQERADAVEYTVEKRSLLASIDQVSLAVQTGFVEDHALTHLRVRGSKAGQLVIEATDRMRYARATLAAKTSAKQPLAGYIKRDDVARLTKVVTAGPDSIPVTIQDHAVVLGNGAKFVSEFRHVLAFPQTSAFLQSESKAKITVARKALIGSVKMCTALIKRLMPDDAYSGVTLVLADGAASFRVGQVKIGKPLSGEITGKKAKIEFNGRLLIEMLRKATESSVTLRICEEPQTLCAECGSLYYVQAPLV